MSNFILLKDSKTTSLDDTFSVFKGMFRVNLNIMCTGKNVQSLSVGHIISTVETPVKVKH